MLMIGDDFWCGSVPGKMHAAVDVPSAMADAAWCLRLRFVGFAARETRQAAVPLWMIPGGAMWHVGRRAGLRAPGEYWLPHRYTRAQ